MLLPAAHMQAGSCEVDARSQEGYTPLHVACMCGHSALVQALVARGASLRHRSSRGATALHFASQCAENLEVLRILLDHPSCSADLVNQKGFRQRSALLLAILLHGNPSLVRALLEAGANPNEQCANMGSISLLHTCAHLARWVLQLLCGCCT